ncbi:MAG: DUF3180 domain-containing protein [Solirubrobacteraceae bacterium]
MTRTKPLTLVLLAVLGATVLWFTQVALATGGRPVLIPPFTLAVALVLIGVIIVAMAWPVWRVSRRVAGARVDPFYATRVVMLAKASSLSGAILAGGGTGVVGYLVTRSVLPPAGSIATAVGAILLLVAGLIAEHWCTIPPDDEDRTGLPETRGTL